MIALHYKEQIKDCQEKCKVVDQICPEPYSAVVIARGCLNMCCVCNFSAALSFNLFSHCFGWHIKVIQ